METNIKPLRDKVLVRPKPVEEVSKGGIIIPETAKDTPVEGTVIAVGSGIINREGELILLDVEVGDNILYKKNGSTITEIEQGGEKYLIMSEYDILAVI
jgi:chaperonin GroES